MITLGMETSCDETSVAIVEDGVIRSNIISSQIPVHRAYGGVVPEIASRKHLENVSSVLDEAMHEANVSYGDLDLIAVTRGPGLIGALLVGVAAAKAMGLALDIPVIGVNHMLGHILANDLSHPGLKPPYIALVVSGGHTYLIEVDSDEDIHVIGTTRDDAAGECFDKVARKMGLPYPGGPEIDRLAAKGNPTAYDFPRAMIREQHYDFSFSGLKTAVLTTIQNAKQKGEEIVMEDLAASFCESVVDVLLTKAFRLMDEKGLPTLVLSGGVSANERLRAEACLRAKAKGYRVYYPDKKLSTDNAAMIAAAGAKLYLSGVRTPDFGACANLSLEEER